VIERDLQSAATAVASAEPLPPPSAQLMSVVRAGTPVRLRRPWIAFFAVLLACAADGAIFFARIPVRRG